MHELSLCRSILAIILKAIESKRVGKVISIHLTIGKLSLVDKESLRFYFHFISKGTLAENAKLHIKEIPGKAFCDICQKDVIVIRRYTPCPFCKHILSHLIEGDELHVVGMEVN